MIKRLANLSRAISLVLISAAGAGCVASSRIGIQPGGDGGTGAGGVGTGGTGAGGVGTGGTGAGGVGTGGTGAGGSLPDGSTDETGACSCSGGGSGLFGPALLTSLDCYCGARPCSERIDLAIATATQSTQSLPNFCAAIRYYSGPGCNLTVVATQWGLDPVGLQVYDSLGALVGVSSGSDTPSLCPFDQTMTGSSLMAGVQPNNCVMTDCTKLDTACSATSSPVACPPGTGGGGGQNGSGGVMGTGGAGGADGGTTFPCNHFFGGHGGFAVSGNYPDAAALDDTCVAGQTYCVRSELAKMSDDYKGTCIAIPPGCGTSPTCACLGNLVECSCAGVGTDLIFTCRAI